MAGCKILLVRKERFYATVPARQQSRAIVVTDKEATNYVIEVDYPITKQPEENTLGDYRNTFIKNIFTGMLNQRLSELSRSSKPPFLYAGTGFNSLARNYEGFTAFTVAGQAGPDTALAALMTEIERVKEYGFTQGELDRAKKQQMAFIEQFYNNRGKTESRQLADEYIRNFLTNEPSPGIENEYKYYSELLPGISLKEVNELATPLKQNENIFVSLQGPANGNVQLPDSTQLLATAQKLLQANVTAV